MMEILGWLWWLLASLASLLASLAWLLVGGWVSTLLQLGLIVLVIFAMKFGWRRAPQELATRLAALGRFLWAWLRSGEPAAEPGRRREQVPVSSSRRASRSRRQPGDVRINVSTCMSLLMLAGLWLLGAVR